MISDFLHKVEKFASDFGDRVSYYQNFSHINIKGDFIFYYISSWEALFFIAFHQGMLYFLLYFIKGCFIFITFYCFLNFINHYYLSFHKIWNVQIYSIVYSISSGIFRWVWSGLQCNSKCFWDQKIFFIFVLLILPWVLAFLYISTQSMLSSFQKIFASQNINQLFFFFISCWCFFSISFCYRSFQFIRVVP